MLERIMTLRNKINKVFYRVLLRPLFFSIDPEKIHNTAISVGKSIDASKFLQKTVKMAFYYRSPVIEQNILGIKFQNPIGLAAGFDKDAEIIKTIQAMGFGFTEVGSITGEFCVGNKKPRLWRLKKSKGLVVNYGLKSAGCEAVSSRLKNEKFDIPLGISIAKTNSNKTIKIESGIQDYVKAYKAFKDIGSYTAINISCPNAYGGEPFTDKRKLNLLLAEIKKIKTRKPIFLKLAVDLSEKQIDDIIFLARKHKIQGFICGNLTKNRDNHNLKEKVVGIGGISGKPVEELSDNLIKHIYKKTKGEFVIMGCGGIFTAEDAYRKIKLGSSLVQLITGMIYEGPQLIAEINQGLVKLLKRDGYKSITQAIGVDVK